MVIRPWAPKFCLFNGLWFPNLEKSLAELQGLFRAFPKPDPCSPYPWRDGEVGRASGVLVKRYDPMEMQQVNIDGLKFPELEALRARIEDRVRDMRETGGPALRDRFMQEAAEIGMTLEEVVQLGTKRRGRPPKNGEEAE